MDKSSLGHFSLQLRNRKFDDKTCFLCAGSLTELEPSDEHVIPKWAQKRFDLWDQQMVLLNGTSISYRHLTIPCCRDCNRNHLQPIETAVANAVAKGPAAVRELGEHLLFLWLGKIFYGLLYKELFLSSDRSIINAPPIIDPETLMLYEDHLFFLQEARRKIETVGFCPASIFVVRTQKPVSNRFQWDFTDNISTLFIGIRMGEVGVLGVLNDGGMLRFDSDVYQAIANHPLHPLQFRELCAAISYQSSIRQRAPTYIKRAGSPHKVFKLDGCSTTPLYKDWDLDQYAQFLSYHTGIPVEKLHPRSNQIISFLYDPEGNLVYMPFEER